MSTVYQQEPPTSGKVVLSTTHGDIDLELWCTETPKACRNFIQLCLEGYYDNTIFHRIIPKFMIQGGDPTGTGRGGKSIYAQPFIDEFHQRLKFSHRGVLAMANENKPNTNNSQFFLTLDKCSFLDRKHTIFGKVVGETLYNLFGMAEEEIGENDRPKIPPRVTVNPYDDILFRDRIEDKPSVTEQPKKEISLPKIKNVKNDSLLSFDEPEDEEEGIYTKNKIVSSHDILQDARLSKKLAVSADIIEKQKEDQRISDLKREKLKKSILNKTNKIEKEIEEVDNIIPNVFEEPEQKSDWAKTFRKNMKNKMKGKRQLFDVETQEEINDQISKMVPQKEISTSKIKKSGRINVARTHHEEKADIESESESESDQDKYLTKEQKAEREKSELEYKSLKRELVRFKKYKVGSVLDENENESLLKVMTPLQLERYQFRQMQKMTKTRERDTLAKLASFTQKLRKTEEDVEMGDDEWMKNTLKFHIDSDKAYALNKAVQMHEQSTELSKFMQSREGQVVTNIQSSTTEGSHLLNEEKGENEIEDIIDIQMMVDHALRVPNTENEDK